MRVEENSHESLDCKTVRILEQESGWILPEKDLERGSRVDYQRYAPLNSRVAHNISRKMLT